METSGPSTLRAGYMYVGKRSEERFKHLNRFFGPWRIVKHWEQIKEWPPPRVIVFGTNSGKLKDFEKLKGSAIRLSAMYGTEVRLND